MRELEPFAIPSVFSRLFALAILGTSYALGHSILEQVLGVLADVILAIATAVVIRRINARNYIL